MFQISVSPLAREIGKELGHGVEIAHLRAAQAEAAGNRLERRPAEDGAAVVDAVGAHLVDLRAIGAVVQDADQDAQAVALERLQLLDVHEQAAVALDQHDAAVAPEPAGGGHAHGERQAVADGAELADRHEALGTRPRICELK